MRRFLLTAMSLVVFSPLLADDAPKQQESADPNDQPMSFWMQKKLDYSRSIVRGLATGDFKTIGMSAERMRLLSKIEGFVRSSDPKYRTLLQTFDRVSNEIARQAKGENLEGATLAFNQLTVNCVNCHKLLRDPERDTTSLDSTGRRSDAR